MPVSIGQLITSRVLASDQHSWLFAGRDAHRLFGGWEFGGLVRHAFWVVLASAVARLLAIFDLSRPMLDWVNPVKAVKSNLNAIIGFDCRRGPGLSWAVCSI